jgi:hypothetical protein
MNMKQNTNPILHITIGTHPKKELSLDQEIRLAKTALLYADHVKLYSLTFPSVTTMMKQLQPII